jgi:GNAT superfamily N-acetyltransferase
MGRPSNLLIKPFRWEDWTALWQLRSAQLAEQGVEMGELPVRPDYDSPYERDYHRIGQVYLTGAGGFWLAWSGDLPVGHVGAQDVGGGVELRRMYVRADYRRRGVGSRLVMTLIEQCARNGVPAIELWTAPHGPGRFLYERLGFQVVGGPGPEFERVPLAPGEIRMRADPDGALRCHRMGFTGW